MFKIFQNEIKSEWKKGHIVVAEFEFAGSDKCRAVAQGLQKNDAVETIYGTVFPTNIYSFDNLREAQNFINAL